MISTHWQLPAAPLRASAVAAVVAGFAGALAIAGLARAVLPVGGIYAVKAGAIFSIVMIVALGFLPRHHPFARFGPANQITTIRAMLVALVAALIGEPRFPIVAAGAAAASLVISALDGVDGWLARRHRIASSFGARFDMEVDALLILALAILVAEFGKAGRWVILSGLLRYVFVAAGHYWPRLRAPLVPSRRRQAICIVQILALTVAIVPAIQPPVSTVIAATALAALAWSFLVDTRWLLGSAVRS
jgi:phosphatidylglycerophosphate synthase